MSRQTAENEISLSKLKINSLHSLLFHTIYDSLEVIKNLEITVTDFGNHRRTVQNVKMNGTEDKIVKIAEILPLQSDYNYISFISPIIGSSALMGFPITETDFGFPMRVPVIGSIL